MKIGLAILTLALALLGCGADETTVTVSEPTPPDVQAPDAPVLGVAAVGSFEALGDAPELDATVDYSTGDWEGILCSKSTGECQHKRYVNGAEMHDDELEHAPASEGAVAAVEKQTCTGGNDECNPCLVPKCCDVEPDGQCPGSGTTWGCSGSTIQRGGPSCIVPDNTAITYCAHSSPSDPNMPFLNAGIKAAVDHLNSRDDVLPPPFSISHRGPASGHPNVCAGWKPASACPGGVLNCLLPFDPLEYPTQVDISFQAAPLHDTPNAYCGLPDADTVDGMWVGCTAGILVPHSGTTKKTSGNMVTPRRYSWNNGKVTVDTYRMMGTIVTLDPVAIETIVDAAPTYGHTRTDRIRWLYHHATCHEIGHAIGLSHAFVGEPGTAFWDKSTASLTCMSPIVPHPSKTNGAWSSGLINGNQFDSNTSGNGNAEGWRLKNMTSAVVSGSTTYPLGRFGYPMTFTTEY